MPQARVNNNNSRFLNVNLVRWRFLFAWTGLVLIQAAIFLEQDGMALALLLILGSWAGLGYIAKPILLFKYPLSSLAVLGYVVSYFLLPPVATLAEGKPLTHNLDFPVEVGVHALLGLGSVISGHWLYRKVRLYAAFRQVLSNGFYRPVGFFRAPSIIQAWIIGGVGIAAMALYIFTRGYSSGEESGVFHAFLRGMFPLAYVPYAFLVSRLWRGREGIKIKAQLILLLIYTLPLLIVALGRNSRTTFLVGVVSIAIAYAYMILTGMMPRPSMRLRNVMFVLTAFFLITGPVTDLALSMVAARSIRGDVDTVTLIRETSRIYQDKRQLYEYKKRQSTLMRHGQWDEYYLDNLFLSRLSNLKFLDSCVGLEKSLTTAGRGFYRHMEMEKIISVLPMPVINLLSIDVNKKYATSGSGGDFLYYAATGDSYAVGGFRTGSLLIACKIVFGDIYPILLALLLALFFSFLDALCKMPALFGVHNAYSWPLFNVLIVGSLYSYVFALTSAASGIESLSGLFNYMIRGWVQVAVMYACVYWPTRLFVIRAYPRYSPVLR